jgi:hypothetical protein
VAALLEELQEPGANFGGLHAASDDSKDAADFRPIPAFAQTRANPSITRAS